MPTHHQHYTAVPFYRPEIEELRFLPEGPRVLQNFETREKTLAWVAIQHSADSTHGSINLLDLESGTNDSRPLPGRPGFFAETTKPGVLLVGLDRKLVLFDLSTNTVEDLGLRVTEDPRVIINDGVAVPGGVLFGTKDLRFKDPIAALYFYDESTKAVRTILDQQTCSNGKAVLGDHLIDIDSSPKSISRYRIEGNFEKVTNPSLIRPAGDLIGYPDGLRPINEDSVLVAFYNPEHISDGVAQQIRVSDGAIQCEWRIPGSPRVTCPEFVAVDGRVKVLFVTAVEGMPPEIMAIAPHAGSFFLADTPSDFRMPTRPPLVQL
ncbi:MAG: SMP-30/gluconolactonase/LRE family protein [Acidobacteria bacterium]|nr:SMP-30/gluconolactonase/LRE family protein [Acidobacteriota bacterium]